MTKRDAIRINEIMSRSGSLAERLSAIQIEFHVNALTASELARQANEKALRAPKEETL